MIDETIERLKSLPFRAQLELVDALRRWMDQIDEMGAHEIPIAPGVRVYHRSGSFRMIVREVNQQGIVCEWCDEKLKRFRFETFPQTSLTTRPVNNAEDGTPFVLIGDFPMEGPQDD